MLAFFILMVTLICDIARATSKACQCNGVLQTCALGPRDVQKAALTTEMSAPNNKNRFQKGAYRPLQWLSLQGVVCLGGRLPGGKVLCLQWGVCPGHPAETSKNSDICDFLKVSDIPNEWWSMEK